MAIVPSGRGESYDEVAVTAATCNDEESDGATLDADLARIVAAWPALPDHIKAAIRGLVGPVNS